MAKTIQIEEVMENKKVLYIDKHTLTERHVLLFLDNVMPLQEWKGTYDPSSLQKHKMFEHSIR